MLDPQTRQQLQTKFPKVKPQLKQRFNGVTDQDLEAARYDPATGRFATPGGQVLQQADVVSPGAQKSWKDLV